MDYPSFNDESDKLLVAGLIGRQEEGWRRGGGCLGLEESPRRRLLMSLQDVISYFTVSDSGLNRSSYWEHGYFLLNHYI